MFDTTSFLKALLLWQTLEHAATSILVGKYFLPLKSVAIKKAIAVIGNIVKNSVLSQRNVILKSGKLRLKPAICKAKLGGAQPEE